MSYGKHFRWCAGVEIRRAPEAGGKDFPGRMTSRSSQSGTILKKLVLTTFFKRGTASQRHRFRRSHYLIDGDIESGKSNAGI
jgi:hypothetical protein